MKIVEDKIDEAAIDLFCLTIHDQYLAWKRVGWQVTNRLFEKGLIYNPVGKAKSVILTN